MRDIRDINNRSPVINPIPLVQSTFDVNLFYLFRDNNIEVEVNIKIKTSTHQLTFKEIDFLEQQFPYLDVHQLKIRTKKYE